MLTTYKFIRLNLSDLTNAIGGGGVLILVLPTTNDNEIN